MLHGEYHAVFVIGTLQLSTDSCNDKVILDDAATEFAAFQYHDQLCFLQHVLKEHLFRYKLLLQGLPTIRAYDVADHFNGLFVTALDRNSSWWYAFLACSRWVGFRLDTLAAITLSFECILVMAVHQRVSLFTSSPASPSPSSPSPSSPSLSSPSPSSPSPPFYV